MMNKEIILLVKSQDFINFYCMMEDKWLQNSE